MPSDILIQDLKNRMNKSIHALEHDLSGLRTGRASVNLLDPVIVEAYGDKMHISQLATVSVPESRMLTVQVWDKSLVKTVEKAIACANLGINTSVDGQIIRLPLPPLTEDRRKELAKLARKYGENSKIALRNIRREAVDETKKMEKLKELSEDQVHKLGDEIQKITDDFIKKLDEKISNKEKEIMEI